MEISIIIRILACITQIIAFIVLIINGIRSDRYYKKTMQDLKEINKLLEEEIQDTSTSDF